MATKTSRNWHEYNEELVKRGELALRMLLESDVRLESLRNLQLGDHLKSEPKDDVKAKPKQNGFNYTDALHVLCRDICKKVKEFRNIDTEKIGYSFNIARNKDSRYGGWASMTPLRFENGASVIFKERRFRTAADSMFERPVSHVQRQYFKCQTVYGEDSKVPLLYIFNVMAPRFMDELSLREKIETVMHELYHIDPKFNGDVRRFPGRNWQHGSKAVYDAKSKAFADEWLATDPNPKIYDFLKYAVHDFYERFGGLYGTKFSKISLIPIKEDEAFRLDPQLKRTR